MTIITRLADIATRYDALFCDLWGCLHNGREPFPEAVKALQGFRSGGGTVILVTNSPRPARDVNKQLIAMGVPQDCYDAIASSGDAAQDALAEGAAGRKVFHIGPERDFGFFARADGTPIDVTRVPLETAEGIVCTGLFDDQTESPDDYRLTIRTGVSRGLKLLCANPDIEVDVGEKRIYCAGAIARAYEQAGGTSLYFGKPHPPIYRLARQLLQTLLGAPPRDEKILCVGDGILTDIPGGISEELDTLFITGGLATTETGTVNGQPDPQMLRAFLDRAQLTPTASIGYLR